MVDEVERLAALGQAAVVDTVGVAELDEVVQLLARVFDVPDALVSLMKGERQWSQTRVGLDLSHTPWTLAFCEATIGQTGVLLVEDATADPRFRENPMVVTAPHIRFYAGAPLRTSGGAAVGVLGVMDTRVRTASAYQQAMLLALAVTPAGGGAREPRTEPASPA